MHRYLLRPTDNLQGRNLADTTPTDGQVIAWSDANKRWQPGSAASGGIGPVSAKTTTYSVLTGDKGKCFTNEGATAQVEFDLPTAAADLIYTFFVQDTDGIKVVANSGDTIRLVGSVSAAAGNITSTTQGSSVTLIAINATEWVAIFMMGNWTVT